MALICRRCGVELHKPTPFFMTQEMVDEIGRGLYKVGWHVEAATDKVWDEAVCLEDMGEEWLEKVNSEETRSEELLHIPIEVTVQGWVDADGGVGTMVHVQADEG